MVGSMRPATAISADGPGNIYNGVAVAADPGAIGRGTLVCLNDETYSASDAVKNGTSNPSAFSSMARGLAGATTDSLLRRWAVISACNLRPTLRFSNT